MQLQLIIEDDEGATTVVPLGPDEVTIGRQEGNTIRLTEQNISRQHAKLCPEPDGWVLEDLASYNGVKVNGVPIQGRVLVAEGDLVQIGDYHLALSEDVDKATLNLDRPEAANEAEPLAATSGPAFRQVDQDAAEATRPDGRVPAIVASGVVAAEVADDVGVERLVVERRPSRMGPIAGVAGVVVVLGLAVAYFMAGGDEPVTEVDGGAKARGSGADAAKAAAVPAVVPSVRAPDVAPDPEGSAAEEPATEEPAAEEPAAEEPAAEEPAAEEPEQKRRKPKTPKRPRPKKKPKSHEPGAQPPPPPPDPGVDPKQLLKEARKAALMGNATQAYNLAKQAYDVNRSQAALEVMGVAACKMGDASKAKAAYSRLGSARRDKLAKVCSGRGITLEPG
jgi:outer membrane biosynthesis protein TonB